MKINIYNLILIFAAFAILTAAAVKADYIPLADDQGLSAGWSVITHDDSVAVEVSEVGFDEVYITIQKTFSGGLNDFGFFQPIIIEFEKNSELARSAIIIDSEIITNNTTHTWYDYHMQLMVNSFNPNAGFTKATPDGDQLEDVSFNENSLYGYRGLPIQLDFDNGEGSGVSNQPELNIFRPGLVSGDIRIQTNSINMEIGDRFGLKQHPTIPEPATIVMLALGVVPAIRNKCRKRIQ